MRAGEAFRAEARMHEEHRVREQLNRRSSSIVSGHKKRAENLSKKLGREVSPPNYTPSQVLTFILQGLGSPCPYSGIKLTSKNFDIDHKIPIDRGGEFTLENSEVINSSANKQKGNLTDVEFAMLMAMLRGFPTEAKLDVLRRLGAGGRMFR